MGSTSFVEQSNLERGKTGLGDIGSLIAGNMPEVQAHAVPEQEGTPSVSQNEIKPEIIYPKHPKTGKPVTTDEYGMAFDPEIHQTDDIGNPRLNKHFKLARRRGMKKETHQPGGQKVKNVISDIAREKSVQARAEQKAVQDAEKKAETTNLRYQSANTAAGLFFAIGRQIGGDEWEPIRGSIDLGNGVTHQVDEERDVTRAFYRYFEAKGIDNLPPETELAVILGGILLIRLQRPVTKSWFQRQIERVIAGFKGFKNRKKAASSVLQKGA